MTKEEALRWWWEGFNATGEGHNGEYTREHVTVKMIEADFERVWAKEKAPAPGGTEAQLELPLCDCGAAVCREG